MSASTPSQEPVAVPNDCDHHYATRIRGGDPLSVRLCTLCGTPDWDDLAAQAADLHRKGWEAGNTDQANSVGQLQRRLRLAHQARFAKVRQLDDIRHALIETGLIAEEDPYGHADLADVIRQNHDSDQQPERCVCCGSTHIAYHNYRDKPFCWPCADGKCPAHADASAEEDRERLRTELRQVRREQAHTEAGDTAALNLATSATKAWEQRAHDLATALSEVLARFTHETHPGQRCLQSGHVPVDTVESWRAILHSTPKEQ